MLTTRRILAVVPGALVVQDGSDGQNVRFPAEHFETVADLLGLRKRRRRELTEAQKAELAERGREVLRRHREANVSERSNERSCHVTPADSPTGRPHPSPA